MAANRSCQAWQHDRRDGRCLKPALKDSDFCEEHIANIKSVDQELFDVQDNANVAGPSRCGSDMHAHGTECQYCHAKDGAEHFQSCPRNPSNTSRIPAEARAVAEAPHAMYDAIADEEYLEPVEAAEQLAHDGGFPLVNPTKGEREDRVGKQLDWRSPISIEELIDMRNRRQIIRNDILRRKGNDYNAQQQNSGDTLFNLRVCELMGIVPTPIDGILVRLSDKLMRLVSLTRPGVESQVTDEKIDDTVDDAVNYLDYMLAIWKRAHGKSL